MYYHFFSYLFLLIHFTYSLTVDTSNISLTNVSWSIPGQFAGQKEAYQLRRSLYDGNDTTLPTSIWSTISKRLYDSFVNTLYLFLPSSLYNRLISSPLESESLYGEMSHEWKSHNFKGADLSNKNSVLYAFGDYYSKRQIDLFFVSHETSSSSTLVVASWDPHLKNFVQRLKFSLPNHVQQVDALVPFDINLDGLLDVVVVYWAVVQNSWLSSSNKKLEILVATQKEGVLSVLWDSFVNASETEFYKDGYRPLTQPFLADVNFDGYADIIFDMVIEKNRPNSSTVAKSPLRFAWINQRGLDFTLHSFESAALRHFLIYSPQSIENSRFASPHSCGFFDVNGDCIPDLVFDVVNSTGNRNLEVWLATQSVHSLNDSLTSYPSHVKDEMQREGQEGSGEASFNTWITRPTYVYTPEFAFSVPKGAQQLSFTDINGDGTIDILFPICGNGLSENNQCMLGEESDAIGFALNIQSNICPSSSFLLEAQTFQNENCRHPEHLCQAKKMQWTVGSKPIDSLISPEPLISSRFSSSLVSPITFRVGDFDADAYPDFLATLHSTKGASSIVLFKTTVLSNESISFSVAKTFSAPWSRFSFDEAAFYDLGDNGLLDIIALGSYESQWWKSGRSTRRILLYEQFAWNEPLFLKISAVNGINCDVAKNRCRGLGSVSLGGTATITGYDFNGQRFVRSAALLSRSAYTALELPYIYMGLGYVNSYIDYFYYGMPLYFNSRNSENERLHLSPSQSISSTKSLPYHRWISLIPKSFVIAYPNPRHDPSKWTLQLSVVPSNMFWTILLTVIFSLVMIGTLVWYLNYREMLEDLKEHQGFKCNFLTSI